MADFKDFNFKLLVIEKLMYVDRTLVPAYSIDERMRARGIEDVQIHVFDNDLAFTVLDESRAFFEELEISDELLASVDTLLIDGGHQVYGECSPVWDGEDDLFDVRSLDDLALLPNLERITCIAELRVPGAPEILAARGIAVD
ncbi:DUF6892 domain-containing protein [Streptomyces sp. NBC_00887]|uniref:DUF6892 domain-containing protein n=1 Tax=Streptomyces sp. NBC_00887 TaxID=2975859 RepID=UPI00386E85CF|nr:hypothetical protein OG844_27435 [Streptomyces sp. NBC_00887]